MASNSRSNRTCTSPGYVHREIRAGVFQCEGRTKENRRCKNDVRGACFCCDEHGGAGRRCSHYVAPSTLLYVPRPPSSASSRQATASSQRAEPAFKAAQAAAQRTVATAQAAAHVQAFVSAGWRDQAREYFIEKMGDKAWSTLEARWRANRCKKFAHVAAEIEARYAAFGRVDEIDQKIPAISTLLQPLNPLVQYVQQSVLTLRTAGIAICAVRGLRLLDCQCFKDLVDKSSLGPHEITWVLNSAISRAPSVH